jgi:hypothetical protein
VANTIFCRYKIFLRKYDKYLATDFSVSHNFNVETLWIFAVEISASWQHCFGSVVHQGWGVESFE